MKYLLLLIAFPMMAATECGKKKGKTMTTDPVMQETVVKDTVPPVVRRIIDSLGKDNPPLVPQQVEEYQYNNQKVYLVTMPCCDFFNPVYDSTGKLICSPTGGFTGRGDGKCADFGEKGKRVKLVWSPPVPSK
jgi:hypothetical protein